MYFTPCQQFKYLEKYLQNQDIALNHTLNRKQTYIQYALVYFNYAQCCIQKVKISNEKS